MLRSGGVLGTRSGGNAVAVFDIEIAEDAEVFRRVDSVVVVAFSSGLKGLLHL
jgi:hypothetical protein